MTRLLPWVLAALLAGCSRQGPPRESDTDAGADAATTAATVAPEASAPRPPPPRTPAEATTPGRAVMSFAMDVHRAWRADEARRGRTAALSPLSLAGGLALLHAGARGETRDELARALHLSAAVTAAELLKLETRSVAGFEVWRGQRIFADGRLTITPEYRNEVGAAFAPLDFRNAEHARGEINRWTAVATRRHIPELLRPGAIDDRTRLVLVDALAAAARWAAPFDPVRTRPQSFTTLGGALESLPMMVAESSQRFARSDAYDAVDLACADAEHALLIIAPAKGHFHELDASLDLEEFDRIVASLAPGRVVVSMPRFRAALPATSLAAELRALGIKQAFDERANLEGIARVSDAKLSVSDVVHAAMIDVDESGARAAAATAVVLAPPAPVPSITLDRPFLFWLRNVRTGAPIVMGRFMGGS
ncbi:serpin family protein [soil metagenome]